MVAFSVDKGLSVNFGDLRWSEDGSVWEWAASLVDDDAAMK